jgi:hypothetical protein
MKYRHWMLSVGVFVLILAGLVSVDERVRTRFFDVMSGGDGLSPWGDRLSDLGSALGSAIRYQSIENAPLLIFATVGAVLFLFMLKT